MNAFDVRIYTIRRRNGRRRPFEVRWQAAGLVRSKSFFTRGLADSYRAELVRAARQGLAFDPASGEPLLWAVPGPAGTTWLEHAVAYADLKWPRLAPHSRASLADALATVTPTLTRPVAARQAACTLRTALYRHAFNSRRMLPGQIRLRRGDRLAGTGLAACHAAQRPENHARPAGRADGAAWTATALRRLPSPASGRCSMTLGLRRRTGAAPGQPAWPGAVVSTEGRHSGQPPDRRQSAQVRAILDEVARLRPELTAFFGCLYYGALRPEEAVALRQSNLDLPTRQRGELILTGACPRTASPWTSTDTPHKPRGLKYRPERAVRVVPVPAVLADLLRGHLHEYGTAPDERLFHGARGGMLSESVYGRVWHAAREIALGSELAATLLTRRPYDLRHAALSLWLNATAAPAEVAARAGNSVHVSHGTQPTVS